MLADLLYFIKEELAAIWNGLLYDTVYCIEEESTALRDDIKKAIKDVFKREEE